jgi:hypothetical protein
MIQVRYTDSAYVPEFMHGCVHACVHACVSTSLANDSIFLLAEVADSVCICLCIYMYLCMLAKSSKFRPT